MSKILVTGGAGFIGSFMTKALLDKGDTVIVLDNLERGHKEVIDQRAEFVKGDIRSAKDVEEVFATSFDAIIHFAGLIVVGESEVSPDLYYKNNVEGSKLLFETAIKSGVKKIIFSSSAAVYGNPQEIPIPEDHPKNPTSNYGANKLEVENILSKLKAENNGLCFAALRYFNAAGASMDGSTGEAHSPETHIIPNLINSVLENKTFKLFGQDYGTKDGTCVRDYIHVLDLVKAHLLALEKLENESSGLFYNVGTGTGFSNREVINMVERISGATINIEESPRRQGDSDTLIADPTKIKQELGFEPKYSDLETIVNTAWKWHTKKI